MKDYSHTVIRAEGPPKRTPRWIKFRSWVGL